MLYYSGITRRVGNVDSGNTVTDFLPLERKRGITIQSAAITFQWPLPQNCAPGTSPKIVNLIDTPGHQDFRFEVDRCLPILDGAVCIIDSVKGVEAHTERVWASAQTHRVPRIVFMNKLDRDGASFHRSVLEVAARLGGWPLVCQLPLWAGDHFNGVVDIIERVGYRWSHGEKTKIPTEALKSTPEVWKELEVAREKLVEAVAEQDTEIMDLWAGDAAEIPADALKRAIRRIIRSGDGKLVPIFAGASFRNMGVEPLMDAVVDYLPSPDERPPLAVKVGSETHMLEDLLHKSTSKKHRSGTVESVSSVFKVFNHPTEGVLCFVRVYHGSLPKTSPTWNTSSQHSERPMGLLQISAEKTEEVMSLATGHIGALRGLKRARTGDTLITVVPHQKPPPEDVGKVKIRPPIIPPAVASLAIDAYQPTVAKKLHEALEHLSREDPSLRWNQDEASDQFVIQGMGKLHLEIAAHNIREQYGIVDQISAGQVEVEYRECLTRPLAPQTAAFSKTLAGKSGKVTCTVTIEPLEAEFTPEPIQANETSTTSTEAREGNIIEIRVPLNSLITDNLEAHQHLLTGVLAGLARGPRRGAAMERCHVYLEVSGEIGALETPSAGHFSNAARTAVQGALRGAHAEQHVGILEPVMLAHIRCPETCAGVIQHDITSAAGGQVLEVNDVGSSLAIDTSSSSSSSSSSTGSGTRGDGSEAAEVIDLSTVYAPADPYKSMNSLADKTVGGRMVELVAKLPLSETLDYDSHLRGKTGGRHSMTSAFDSWERVVGQREKNL